MKYNAVQFYYTATTTFDTLNPVTSYVDIQADSIFTIAYDINYTTGYGWFRFYNLSVVPYTYSQESNPIPYTGFEDSSVKVILDTFYSALNNKEQKLITLDDAFSYLNEAYSIAQSNLNMVNGSYTVPVEYTISVVAGTAEYSLPTNFSDVVSLFNDDLGQDIYYIELEYVANNNVNVSDPVRYYLRGTKIGFSPTPTTSGTYKLRYKSKTTRLTSYDDEIDLPTNNFYFLKDFMMYRALPKLQRSAEAEGYYKSFSDGLNLMKIDAHKQNNEKEIWGMDPTTNV